MSDAFTEFVQAEVRAILDSMNEECRNDPVLCRRVALEWIEKNAEEFRRQWDRSHLSQAS